MQIRNKVKRLGAVSAGVLIVSLGASPAFAATVSQAEGTAIKGSLAGTTLVTTGTASAQNDQSQPTVTSTASDKISVLPGQGAVNTGVLTTTATANDDGTSVACAGVVGEGGSLSVGQDGTCTPDNGTSPALIDLANIPLVGSLSLEAGAIYGTCTAAVSDGDSGFSASAHLADVALVFQPLIGPPSKIAITLDQPVSLPSVLQPLVSLDLNQVDATGPKTSATALQLTVLGAIGGAALADITIGQVACGPNATTAEVPMIPAAGAPLALGTVALGGVGLTYLYSRLRKSGTRG